MGSEYDEENDGNRLASANADGYAGHIAAREIKPSGSIWKVVIVMI